MKKKLLLAITSLVVIVSGCAQGTANSNISTATENTSEEIITTEAASSENVTTEDKINQTESASETESKVFSKNMLLTTEAGFNNSGYTEIACEKDGAYQFFMVDSDKVEWLVYLFDQRFDDGYRYIGQAAEPVVAGNGKIQVKAGQYMYIYCSNNAFTSEKALPEPMYEITFNE